MRSAELTRAGVHPRHLLDGPRARRRVARIRRPPTRRARRRVVPSVQFRSPIRSTTAAPPSCTATSPRPPPDFAPADAKPLRDGSCAPLTEHASALVDTFLSPLQIPHSPIVGRRVRTSTRSAARRARALALRPATNRGRSWPVPPRTRSSRSRARAPRATGCSSALLAHASGWPVARGGSQQLADALGAILTESRRRDRDRTTTVTDLAAAPTGCRATLLDVTPRQFLAIAGDRITGRYRRALTKFRYGPGVFKLDWALSGPIPWTNAEVHACGHRAPRRHARRDHRGRGRGRRGRSPRPPVRDRRAADRHGPELARPRARTSRGPTATCRTDRRSTRPTRSRTRSNVSRRAFATSCSPATR